MSGQRQPVELIKAKGAKHMTQAEEAERQRKEVKAPVPKTAKPPKWLPESLQKAFRDIGKKLISLGIYSALDADALGRYLVSQHQYLLATDEAEKALAKKDMEAADSWGRIQERYVRQARGHAADLGLTISARCRLVIPEALKPKEDPEEAAFLKLLEGRRRNA